MVRRCRTEHGGQRSEDRGQSPRRLRSLADQTSDYQGVNPMRGRGGVGAGGGFRICITSCRTCTIAASCTSNRAVSFFSSPASFRASSGVPRSASRIFAKARTTKMLTRGLPRRSVASPCDQCSPSNGVPARRIHLNSACAVQNVGSHQRPVFREGVWQIFYVLAPLQGHNL